MTAFWIFPFDILMRTTNPAASTLMTTLITYMHSDVFPFVNFRRAENSTNLVGTFSQTNVFIHHGQMRFGIGVETNKVLFFFDRLTLFLFTHYFITFHARYASRASLSFSFGEPRSFHIFFCFSHLDLPSTVNIWLAARLTIGIYWSKYCGNLLK